MNVGMLILSVSVMKDVNGRHRHRTHRRRAKFLRKGGRGSDSSNNDDGGGGGGGDDAYGVRLIRFHCFFELYSCRVYTAHSGWPHQCLLNV